MHYLASRSSIGGRATDVHTYVLPALELIYEQGSPAFRGSWGAVEDRTRLALPIPGVGDWETSYLRLARPGEPRSRRSTDAPRPLAKAGAPTLEAGILHDNATGRLRAMDVHGIGAAFLAPGPSVDACLDLGPALAVGFLGAYNRYCVAYCAADPARLRCVLQIHAGEPELSAREISELGTDPSIGGVTVHLPAGGDFGWLASKPLRSALGQSGIPLFLRSDAEDGRGLGAILTLLEDEDPLQVPQIVLAGWAEDDVIGLMRRLRSADRAQSAELPPIAIGQAQTRPQVERELEYLHADRPEIEISMVWQSDFPFCRLDLFEKQREQWSRSF